MYKPEYQITNTLLKYISEIESARSLIESAPLLPRYERKFQKEATIRKVHFSTAIEDNYLYLNEVEKLVKTTDTDDEANDPTPKYNTEIIKKEIDTAGLPVVARSRDIHEVINYRELMSFFDKLLKDFELPFSLSKETLFDMHKVLLKNIMDDKSGMFRTEKAVTVNFITKEKLDIYEATETVPQKVEELLDWYNTSVDVHPVIKAGLLHLELARIHPFNEGNGRMARATATLTLSAEGYGVKNFFCLDEYYDSNSEDYYTNLGIGFDNPTPWLEYFSLGMAIEFNRVKDRVLKISKDAKIKEQTGQNFITERQEEIIEWINDHGYFMNKDFLALFPDISDDTVLRELKGLIEYGIIKKVGKTKSSRYELIKA